MARLIELTTHGDARGNRRGPGVRSGPLDSGRRQLASSVGVGKQRGKRGCQVSLVRTVGIGHRVATNLGQGQASSRQHGGATGHRLEEGQAEPLAEAGVGQHLGTTEQGGHERLGDEAGAENGEVCRHLREGRVDSGVPSATPCQDKRRVTQPSTQEGNMKSKCMPAVVAGSGAARSSSSAVVLFPMSTLTATDPSSGSSDAS